jgi:hypothetical protein
MGARVDSSALLTVAAIIAAVGFAVLLARIPRELHMKEKGERTWIPWADWLALGSTFLSMGVVAALMIDSSSSSFLSTWLRPTLSAAVVLVVGYAPAVLAHYRLLSSGKDKGPRDNPEPAERWIVLTTILLAAFAAYMSR